ncbi:g1417 [Coccomyxa viridis]|uniref:G1417 protein n=1 Tax=Coccomyxa viridis TaxID=1274662 RepID=A0ABP1FHY6_9CHLO
MTRSAVQHGVMNAPRGNQRIVFIAVAGALAFAALPFISKQVRKREQEVANMRDASYDAKDAARNARLRVKS